MSETTAKKKGKANKGNTYNTNRTAQYCSSCGFRIRGKHHVDGIHHTAGRDGQAKVGE